jgi:hypothetical protein
MDGRLDSGERRRRTIGALVVAVLFALPGVAYAQAALLPGRSGTEAPRVLEPTHWQAFRTGATVEVVAAVRAPVCTVRWAGGWFTGGAETVVARDGRCRTTRPVDRPGLYTLTVSTTGPTGETQVPVAVYDPRAGVARGVGEAGAFRVTFEAAYVPWRRSPLADGEGALAGPDGLTAEVDVVDWVVATPDGTTAVKGTAVAPDGTPYGFVAYGADTADPLELVVWPAGEPIGGPLRPRGELSPDLE